MSRGKREMKKPTKAPSFVTETLIGAIVDLIIGLAAHLIADWLFK